MPTLTPVDHDPFAAPDAGPTLTPVEHDPFAQPAAAAPVEPGAWNDPAQHSRFGQAAMGSLMRGAADIIDTERQIEKGIAGDELPGSKYVTGPLSDWLKRNAPQSAPAQTTGDKAWDIAGNVAGGLAPGALEYAGRLPFAAAHGYATAEEEAQAQGREPRLGEIARDVGAEMLGRHFMGKVEGLDWSKIAKAAGFGAITGAQDVAEGRPASEALQNAGVNALIGAVLPGGAHEARPAEEAAAPVAEPQAAAPATAAPAQPVAAPRPPEWDVPPAQNETIGLKFPKGPSKRGTVEQLFDNGASARVRFDDGTAGDYTMADIMRDRTEPPPPMAEREIVGRPAPDIPLEEREDDWAQASLDAAPYADRPAAPLQLGSEIDANLRHADLLERGANDYSNRLTDEERVQRRQQAYVLRQQYGADNAQQRDTRTPDERQRDQEASAQRADMAQFGQVLGQQVPSHQPEAIPLVPAADIEQQREQAVTNILGQNVPGALTAPPAFTPDQLAAAQAARAAPAPATPLMGQQVQNVPLAQPIGATPQEMARAQAARAAAQPRAPASMLDAFDQPVQRTAPEPPQDIAAQIRTMLDPRSTKDATFVAAGNENAIPRYLPQNVLRIDRPEGTLLTTDPQKAMAYGNAPTVTDENIANLLGYTESKNSAAATGQPLVVQAMDHAGSVVAAQAASPAGHDAAVENIRAQAPDAAVSTTTPDAALQSRASAMPADARPIADTEAITSKGQRIPVTLAVIDARTLVTSHDENTLRPNPAYPPELQPRDRTRGATEVQLNTLLNPERFSPELMTDGVDAAAGAPIVGADGLVESGNARTMAIRRAYQQDLLAARAYRAHLEANGFPVEGMEQPMLVRINRAGGNLEDRAELARDMNRPMQAAMSATERAAADAASIPDHVVDLSRPGDFLSAANRPFVKAILQRIATPQEIGTFVRPDGSLSTEGVQRVRNAILSKAYGNQDLIGSLVEDPDTNFKAIGNALIEAAPDWMRLRRMAAAGEIPPELDLTKPLLDAVQLISRARSEGRPIAEYLRQHDIFSGQTVPPETEAMVRWMLGGEDFRQRIGQAKIAKAMRLYAELASKVEPGPNLFGETMEVKPTEVAEVARERAQREEEPGAQPDLLRPSVGEPAGTAAVGPRPGDGREAARGREAASAGTPAPEGGGEPLTAEAGRQTWREPGTGPGAEPPRPTRNTIDRTAEFQRFAKAMGHDLSDPAAAQKAAASYVLQRGNDHGNEYYAAIDRAGTSRDAGTSNHPGQVTLSRALTALAESDGADLVYHHNHRNGSNLSQADNSLLRHPGIGWIVAHTPDGHLFASRLTDEMQALRQEKPGLFRSGFPSVAYAEAFFGTRQVLQKALDDGKISVADANQLHQDLISHSLASAGIIDHINTRPIDAKLADIADQAHDAGVAQLNKFLRLNKVDPDGLNHEYDYRAAASIRPIEALGRLSGEATRPPGEPGPEYPDQGRGAQPPGNPTGRSPQQLQLLAGEDTFEDTGVPRPVIPGGNDPIDDVTRQNASALTEGGGGGRGLGTYTRAAMRALPGRVGDVPEKWLGNLQSKLIRPLTVGSMDHRFGRLVSAVREQMALDNSLRYHWTDMQRALTALQPEQRQNLYAAEELARLQNRVIEDDGRSLVIRNESAPNAQLSKPGQTVTLDAPTTAAYHESREMFRDIWKSIMQAGAARFGWKGELDPVAIRAAADAAEHPAIARNYRRAADLVEQMQANERQAYVPFMRFGDYFIAVKPTPGSAASKEMQWAGEGFPPSRWFQLVESKNGFFDRVFGKQTRVGAVPDTAKAEIAKLQAQFPEADGWMIDHGYTASKDGSDAIRNLNVPAIDKLLTVLGQKDEKLYGGMVDELKEQMYKELVAGFKKQAADVPGYSTDFSQARGRYIGWTARHTSELVHRDNVEQAQAYMDTHPDPAMRRYANNWLNYLKDPSEEFQALRQFGFYWQLAGNPSSSFLVATHGPMVAHAVMSAAAGVRDSGASLYSAFGQAVRAIKFDTQSGIHVDFDKLGQNLTADERQVLQRAMERGQMHNPAADDLRGITYGYLDSIGPNRSLFQRALDIAASNVAVADQVNRAGVLLGAYRLAQKPGMLDRFAGTWGEDQNFRNLVEAHGLTPETVARHMVDEGLFVWGKQNRAPVQRGGAAAMLFQFRNFEINYLGTLYKMMTRMGPEGRAAGTFMLAGLGALGGMLAEPFAQDAENLVDWAGKLMTGIDPMADAHVREFLEDMGWGKVGSDLIVHGPTRALGVDLSSRLGFGDVTSRSMNGLEALGVFPAMIIQRLETAYNRATKGRDYVGAGAELLPTAARNLVRGAVEMPAHGVTTQYGNTVVPPEKLGAGDQAAQAMGFEPTTVARAYEQRVDAQRYGAREQELRSALTSHVIDLEDQIAHAQRTGDQATVAELTDRVRQIYAANPDVHISAATVRRGVAQRLAPAAAIQQKQAKELRGRESPYPGP